MPFSFFLFFIHHILSSFSFRSSFSPISSSSLTQACFFFEYFFLSFLPFFHHKLILSLVNIWCESAVACRQNSCSPWFTLGAERLCDRPKAASVHLHADNSINFPKSKISCASSCWTSLQALCASSLSLSTSLLPRTSRRHSVSLALHYKMMTIITYANIV